MADLTYFRGDTLKGNVTLRQSDPSDSTKTNPFSIPVGATVEVHFPADPTLAPLGVVASTANAGEVSIINATLGQFSFKLSAAKSANLKMDAVNKQPLDVVVTDTSATPNEVTTFEGVKLLKIKDRANT